MPRRATIGLALLAAAATGSTAPAAGAATLKTENPCYQETQEVVVGGTGFAPLSIVTVSRVDRVLGTTQADVNGAFRAKFDTPELPDDVRERRYPLSATDMVNTAATAYRATRVFANFRPGSGNPATLRVRFSVNGFGLRRSRAPVYLHYVRPNGKERRTIRLGRAAGVCGKITRTKKRKLFPFRAERGRWILQFDTRRRYERATSKRRTPWVRKPVEIFSRRR